MVKYDFSGKTALVTGGSSGLGLATVKALASAGASVIAVSRNVEKARQALSTLKGSIRFIQTDLAKLSEVDHLFKEIQTHYPSLDFALNNAAGEAGIGKPLQAFTEEDFDQTFTVNLKSLWLCMKHEIDLMQKDDQSFRQILNVSSVNGLGGVAYGSLYAASKAGVIALSKSAALELAGTTIAVNVLVPGAFDTPLLQKAIKSQTNGVPEQYEAVKKQYEQAIPTGKIASPEEFAQTVLWLCSGSAPYIRGHSLILDGGLSAHYR